MKKLNPSFISNDEYLANLSIKELSDIWYKIMLLKLIDNIKNNKYYEQID